MAKRKKRAIRVGIIRCDTHGMYFGPLMEKHDPVLFDMPVPMSEPAPYTWMRGGNHYYFYTHYCDPTRMTVPRVEGFELVKLWDANRHAAEIASKVFYGKPKVCNRFEEVSDDVDLVLIGDCNGEGKDHLKLATPGLKKGVATLVDKPFAYTVVDARAMLRLADRHKAPIMSLSMLRTTPATTRFRDRLADTGGVNFGSIDGGGTGLQGLIHSISLARHVFGAGIQTVRVLSAPNQTLVYLDYGDRPDRPKHGVVIHCNVGKPFHSAMYISAIGERGKVDSIELGDWQFPYAAAELLRLARQMALTRKSPIPREEMIECIAVAEAVRRAQKLGRAVKLDEVTRSARS